MPQGFGAQLFQRSKIKPTPSQFGLCWTKVKSHIKGDFIGKYDAKHIAGFLIPSIIGILLFMVPIQFDGGYYSAREASIVSTTFSAVPITFSIVVLAQVDLMDYFGHDRLLICTVSGLILGSKIPVNLLELFILFLERTTISLLIACPLAHLLF